MISLRIDPELVAAIDASAMAEGISRSAWMTRACRASLNLPATGEGARRGRPARPKGHARLQVRMGAEELLRIEEAAAKHGVTLNEFVRATLRGRVWPDQLVIMPNPETKKAMRETINELHAIGRNLNQVVHAMHAAALPGSGMNIENIAIDLKVAAAEASASALAVERAILEHLSAEQDIWRWRL